jgi:hypothetical protein
VVKWVIAAVEPKRAGQLSFGEYVHMICFYSMLSPLDVQRFVFGSVDVERKQYLTRDAFHTVLEHLCENSSYAPLGWQIQYDAFAGIVLTTIVVSAIVVVCNILSIIKRVIRIPSHVLCGSLWFSVVLCMSPPPRSSSW